MVRQALNIVFLRIHAIPVSTSKKHAIKMKAR